MAVYQGYVQTGVAPDLRDGGAPAEAGGVAMARIGLFEPVQQADDLGLADGPLSLLVDSKGITARYPDCQTVEIHTRIALGTAEIIRVA